MRMEGGSGARTAMKASGLYDVFRTDRMATPRASDAAKGGRGDVLAQLTGQENRHAGMLGTPTANPAPRGSMLRRCKGRMTSEQDDFNRTPTIGETLYFEEHQPLCGMLPTPLAPNGGRRLSAREIGTEPQREIRDTVPAEWGRRSRNRHLSSAFQSGVGPVRHDRRRAGLRAGAMVAVTGKAARKGGIGHHAR